MTMIAYFIMIFMSRDMALHQEKMTQQPVSLLTGYAYITGVTVGPWETLGEDSSKCFRVVTRTYEIYNNLSVEMITADSEGYNKQVKVQYDIDMSLFRNKFHISDEHMNVHFLKWLSPHKLKLRVDDKCFVLELSEKESELKINRCK